MGLDVTSYSRAIRIGDYPDHPDGLDGLADYDSVQRCYLLRGQKVASIYPASLDDFPHHAMPLTGGIYSFHEQYHFRAGSYSGYNVFRDWISQQILGKTQDDVCHLIRDCNPATYPDQGIVWLVYFSDCEGIISGERCEPILAGLEKHKDRLFAATKSFANSVYYHEKVEDWIKALALAVDGGFVKFH